MQRRIKTEIKSKNPKIEAGFLKKYVKQRQNYSTGAGRSWFVTRWPS